MTLIIRLQSLLLHSDELANHFLEDSLCHVRKAATPEFADMNWESIKNRWFLNIYLFIYCYCLLFLILFNTFFRVSDIFLFFIFNMHMNLFIYLFI